MIHILLYSLVVRPPSYGHGDRFRDIVGVGNEPLGTPDKVLARDALDGGQHLVALNRVRELVHGPNALCRQLGPSLENVQGLDECADSEQDCLGSALGPADKIAEGTSFKREYSTALYKDECADSKQNCIGSRRQG